MNNITLAICAYNSEKYIEETLNCIVNQTFQDFDLLIVNDASTDHTKSKIVSFFKKHQKSYQFVDFELNKGIAFGRKYVLENVHTEYIIFVDSDDKPNVNLVEKLYSKIESDADLMAVGCYLEYIDKNGTKIGGGLFLGEKTKERFIHKAEQKKLIFMQPTAIFKREIALKAGGIKIDGYFDGKPRYQDLCEDLDLWTRMSDYYVEGKAIIVIPEILCQYRKMENTTSTNTIGMMLKMRFVKSNLLSRRNSKKEQTFVNYFNSISDKDMMKLKKEAKASSLLREGVFSFKNRNLFKAFHKITYSVFLHPNYALQKFKSNILRQK
ncbi:glycosyltransferase family 2 protein [bacterium]|nr:glycosyltransferase family 2 protein [bacterium]